MNKSILRKHIPALGVLSLLFCGPIACGDETAEPGTGDDKADLDEDAREMILDPDGDGVAEGSVDGAVASMDFEFAEPLPELEEADGSDDSFRSSDATEDAALSDVLDALEIIVSSPRSGVSVSLMADGALVPSPPTGPGQWSATLADDRMSVEFEWYNGTASGLSLKSGETYDVVYSVGGNCCVERISATSTKFEMR